MKKDKLKSIKKGFTLIELLVVISIIGFLTTAAVVLLNSARIKARDAKRLADLTQLTKANEMRFAGVSSYAGTAGWFSNSGHGGLDAALTPTYISKIPDDPINKNGYIYMYWRKDFRGYGCLTSGTAEQFGFYARLENPSASDQATIKDTFDVCVKNTWGINYKAGN